MLQIIVIDGMGGGIGSQVVAQLGAVLSPVPATKYWPWGQTLQLPPKW